MARNFQGSGGGFGSGPRERKKPAISFSTQDWRTLRAALEKDRRPESAVLLVLLATGLRIGDVLRIQVHALRTALREPEGVLEVTQKGGSRRQIPVYGAKPAWERLAAICTSGRCVADAICPSSGWGATGGGGAYKRVSRHLQRLSEEQGLSGRFHLHRIRRTFATRALSASHDVHLVKQLLGHASITATERYTDELRADEVAAAQKQLWELTK